LLKQLAERLLGTKRHIHAARLTLPSTPESASFKVGGLSPAIIAMFAVDSSDAMINPDS
jgi:hypothetical protein